MKDVMRELMFGCGLLICMLPFLFAAAAMGVPTV